MNPSHSALAREVAQKNITAFLVNIIYRSFEHDFFFPKLCANSTNNKKRGRIFVHLTDLKVIRFKEAICKLLDPILRTLGSPSLFSKSLRRQNIT